VRSCSNKAQWVKLALAVPFRRYLEKEVIPAHFKGVTEYKDAVAGDAGLFGRNYLNDEKRRDDKKTIGLAKQIGKIVANVAPRKPSHYYLPGKDSPAAGFLVDFSNVTSVPFSILRESGLLTRLKSPWREQLLGRYVNFSSRVGTPDYKEEYLFETIKAFFPDEGVTREKIFKKK